jgi:hypothetical protein
MPKTITVTSLLSLKFPLGSVGYKLLGAGLGPVFELQALEG